MSDKQIKLRCEDAITAYLQQFDDAGEEFEGITIQAAHSETYPDPPLMIITADNSSPVDDMPPKTGIREVRLLVQLQIPVYSADNANSKTREAIETILGCIASRLSDSAADNVSTPTGPPP